ncbi:GAF sensor signal transduction histidine kinase [Nitrosospira sp. Nsp2]|uniref:GAF domain-containing sensor histidine kinase n=1 Tax=Nitrosospira sp. Nsp2 TaxID=136548 RepID=UPI000D31CD5C|nr:GAF domain-containing sensor histidine kinase [Nitrosospira sp. Nsp2]PTR16235.1 GAF sensor signal transduction histidine kinase [Nitrosospira sp. Nsp2]
MFSSPGLNHPNPRSLIPAVPSHARMDEAKRLQAVRRYDILDTPPDGAYDRITALAARLFGVPIAIVSIVDTDRIWFKSHHGLDATETGRDLGLCASAILQNGPYVIEDAANDARALSNPLVAGGLGLRFYAAVPLTTTDGFNLGTLCVIDKKPRILGELEIENLRDLASLVMDQLELRLSAIRTVAELNNAKASAVNASLAKTDFVSTLCHELRSPLNSILGYAQLLELEMQPLQSSQLAGILEILKAGRHQSKLIDQILDLAVIESGKLSMVREVLPLFEVLSECLSMIKPAAQVKGVHLGLPHNDVHSFVYADRTRLKQILINLLSNAIKYNREGGTVTVECNRSSQGRIRVSVKDTGIGLPPEKLAQLFQAYNRLGQESGSEKGTGIGLTVTRKLVEMMEGNIGVESTVGVGSVFWIELISGGAPPIAEI